jgi:TetR/AcrR family transcriptional repressor of nem operon
MGRTSDARQRLIDAANDLIWAYSYGAITIDAICERATVKKGSFYYFFSSKSELAVVAINVWWTERHAVLERIFRQDIPPLARIRDYLEFVARRQLSVYEETGQVLGCPIYGLGAEISTQDEQLRLLVVDILRSFTAYLEEAIREAQSLGHAPAGDPAQKAQRLSRYYAGMLTQARIENNPEPIRNLACDGLELIGAAPAALALIGPTSTTDFPPRGLLTPSTPPSELARS